jgi:acyl-CoA synthetase (AMP-forming)/AMP-acid ligase II
MGLLVGDLFRGNAAAVPSRLAATLGEQEITYAELERRGNRTANALRGLGLVRGDRLLSWTDTTLDVLPVYVACAKLGVTFAPMNPRFGVAEASELASFARAAALVADGPRAAAADDVAAAAGIRRLARLGGECGDGLDLGDTSSAASDASPSTPDLDERDPQVLFFTSGSTGRPKGVLLSHRVNRLRAMVLSPAERTLCMFPLFHMAGYSMALNAWSVRGTITFVATPTAEVILAEVERRRIDRLYCIPAVWARVLEADRSRYRLDSLRMVDTGTSATPPELIEALKEAFPGTTTAVYYGSTECGPGAILTDEDVLRKPGSVGRPAPGVELRTTADGELCVRSELLMSGYFDDPRATREALRDGWYHTGDVASIDGDGFVWIVGRVREIIRTGGETVAPIEVERALADHPGVREVAVVGLPDERWGEIVCAVVVPLPGTVLELEELRAHLAGRLAPYKHPRRLELAAELPRTAATRQVQRALLVERLRSTAPPGR